MSMDTGRYQLYSAFKTLQARWDETIPHWQDAVQQEFEERFWNQLDPKVKGTLTAIDRLGQIMARARQECE